MKRHNFRIFACLHDTYLIVHPEQSLSLTRSPVTNLWYTSTGMVVTLSPSFRARGAKILRPSAVSHFEQIMNTILLPRQTILLEPRLTSGQPNGTLCYRLILREVQSAEELDPPAGHCPTIHILHPRTKSSSKLHRVCQLVTRHHRSEEMHESDLQETFVKSQSASPDRAILNRKKKGYTARACGPILFAFA